MVLEWVSSGQVATTETTPMSTRWLTPDRSSRTSGVTGQLHQVEG
jgi:hypothetical protein